MSQLAVEQYPKLSMPDDENPNTKKSKGSGIGAKSRRKKSTGKILKSVEVGDKEEMSRSWKNRI